MYIKSYHFLKGDFKRQIIIIFVLFRTHKTSSPCTRDRHAHLHNIKRNEGSLKILKDPQDTRPLCQELSFLKGDFKRQIIILLLFCLDSQRTHKTSSPSTRNKHVHLHNIKRNEGSLKHAKRFPGYQADMVILKGRS